MSNFIVTLTAVVFFVGAVNTVFLTVTPPRDWNADTFVRLASKLVRRAGLVLCKDEKEEHRSSIGF